MAKFKMLLVMILLFSVASFVRQGIVGAHVLYIDKEFNNTMLTLKCAVDNYVSEIRFTLPNNKTDYAYCVVPYKSDTQCYCSCNSKPTCKCNISQNTLTKITTLQISDTEMTDVFGWYTCSHGSHNKSIIVARPVLLLDKEVSIGMINLNCTGEQFTSRMDFFFPNNLGHAYCIEQSPLIMKCFCSCNSSDTCYCTTNQDLATKTTTLRIVDNDLTGLFGWYTCALGSNKKSIMISKPVLRLDIEVNDTTIKLNCALDEITSRIYFVFPNNNLGYACCNAPEPSNKPCNCSCNLRSTCECNIIQDIATKITTLELKDNNLTNMFGLYTCVHGLQNKSVMVAMPGSLKQDNADCQTNTEAVYIALNTIGMTIAYGLLMLVCLRPDIPGRIKRWIAHFFCRLKEKTDNSWFEKKAFCSMCNGISVCGTCVDCKEGYCYTCCKYHVNQYMEHRVCQIQNVTNTQSKITCKTCVKLANKFCGVCWELCCTLCAKGHMHDENKQIMIYQALSGSKQHMSIDTLEKLHYKCTKPIENDKYQVRISGIVYLEDKTLVAVDCINEKLIIFKAEKQLQKDLKEEPCALTAMTGNKIAVTFPQRRKIKIFEIKLKTTEKFDAELNDIGEIDICSKIYGLGKLKPFTIAYDNNCFAVEVGEGDDGMIIVLDNGNRKFINQIKCKFAYFTGHTIRLALKINTIYDGRLFVSVISKKMVACINLKGEELLWHTFIPSPRSIVVLEDFSSYSHIILSSKKSNSIYELKKKKGEKLEILKLKYEIRSPRYMAYHRNDKMLCVLAEKKPPDKDSKDKHNDELIFLNLNGREFEPNEETNCLADTKV